MSPARQHEERSRPDLPAYELPTDRRGMGSVFLGLGLAGTLLFAIALVALLLATPSALAAGNASGSIRDARQVVVDAAGSLRSVDRSLAATQASSQDAAQSLDSFAATLRATSGASSSIDVLGQHPFASLSQLLDATADLATKTAKDLRTSSDSLQASRDSAQPLAADLDRLAARLDTLGGGSAVLLSPLVWWLLIAIVAWLLAMSLGVARFGWLLRRGRPTQPV